MIKLTRVVDEQPVFIAPENITAVNIGKFQKEDIETFKAGEWIIATKVECGAERYIVKEAPEEVVRKIMDYKLAMINFNHDAVAPQAEQKLFELAGLEQNHEG